MDGGDGNDREAFLGESAASFWHLPLFKIKTMTNIERLIETCLELGSAKTMETLGVTSGEISQRRARDVYGKYFTDADKAGRIRPCRIEDGRAGTRWYRVVDILKMKAADAARAELKY